MRPTGSRVRCAPWDRAQCTLWGNSVQCILWGARPVRLVRASVLSLREQPYVEVAVATGSSRTRIILRHLLPNATAPIIVQITYQVGVAILFEAGLSFLGVGIPPSTPSWGNMMSEGRALWLAKPHLVLFPAMFLTITILAVNMIGDGLRDTLDPRMKKRF